MDRRALLERLWWTGVDRVRGDAAVREALSARDSSGFTHVLAIGKAAVSMARAAREACPAMRRMLILTKHGHAEDWVHGDARISYHEAGHPVPDADSLEAGELALDFVRQTGPGARLLMLVSGGGSALVEALPAGWDLDRLQAFNRQMLADGLDIHAINKRRKEISRVKGGKLLATFGGAGALVLTISDVEGDDPSIIASGVGMIPASLAHAGFEAEIIASNAIARMAIDDAAQDLDLDVIVNTENLYRDVFDAARACADIVRQGAPGLYIFGGEPTTILPENPGEGGRNQALAVAMARELAGVAGVAVLAAGTDGSDGPTGSAGGFVTGEDWARHPGGEAALAEADSGKWLRRTGGLFVTGPTGTNVMDLLLVLKAG